MLDEEKIISLINSIHRISRQSSKKLIAICSYERIGEGNVFAKRDRRNENEYFILSGICRSYVLNPEGKEVTLAFHIEGSPISPNISRTYQSFSNVNIQALTDVEIAPFPTAKLMALMIENREIREWGNTVLQNELLLKVERELSLATMTAKERLKEFRKKYTLFENLLPHSYISSYLGITNISLSRLRRELMRR